MVQHSSVSVRDAADIQTWLDTLGQGFTPDEIGVLRRACERVEPLYAGQSELTGTPLLQHALGAASILAGMRMDHETIAATLLHAVPACSKDWQISLQNEFGGNIARLVEGISRMEQIRQFSEMPGPSKRARKDGERQIEGWRQMLLAMVEDIRVVLIKLAERTQTMRRLSAARPELQQQVARETRALFAPLANRLGVWQLKWELEDLSLRYLEPQLYKKVAGLLDERRVDREQYIADVVAQLKQALERAGIRGEVSGRPKHIYSIINKMKRKHLDFSELYDVRALRILVDDVKDCYAALGLVHDMWQPIPGEFDDYIAQPKSNDYQSLHTAVHGPRDLAIEVQIRTYEMHQHSELGVAAHWRYKEGGKPDARLNEKIAWLRQILAWKDEVANSAGTPEPFLDGLADERVYVLTPQGRVIDLPHGATPVDFAYSLHTDIGHRTRGAKVNGSIVPLGYPLQSGQRVEILTVKQGGPSRDWLNPAQGYLKSARARAKVRHWFKTQNPEDSISQGRALLDRELHRLGVNDINQVQLAQRLGFHKLEELLAALGHGDITPRRAGLAIVKAPSPRPAQPGKAASASQEQAAPGVLVEGVGNLMTKLAKCCQPHAPDAIVGYVTRERGITIHRRDCPFMQRVPQEREERMLDAEWGSR